MSRAQEILEKLDSARVMRTVESHPDQPEATRYELYHDTLALAALSWTAEQKRLDELAKMDRRAQKWGFWSLLILPAPVGLWFGIEALRAKPRDRPTRREAMTGLVFSSVFSILLFLLGLLGVFDPLSPNTLEAGTCQRSPVEVDLADGSFEIEDRVGFLKCRVYFLQMPADGTVAIAVIGLRGFDPIVELGQPDGRILDVNDDYLGTEPPLPDMSDRDSFLSLPLEPGNYLVAVRGYDGQSGSYRLVALLENG